MQHLQKTEGWGCSSHSGTHPPLGLNLSFQSLTHCPFCNPFVFTFMRLMGGCVHPGGSILQTRHSHEGEESPPSAASPRYFLTSLLHYFLPPLQSLRFHPVEE